MTQHLTKPTNEWTELTLKNVFTQEQKLIKQQRPVVLGTDLETN